MTKFPREAASKFIRSVWKVAVSVHEVHGTSSYRIVSSRIYVLHVCIELRLFTCEFCGGVFVVFFFFRTRSLLRLYNITSFRLAKVKKYITTRSLSLWFSCYIQFASETNPKVRIDNKCFTFYILFKHFHFLCDTKFTYLIDSTAAKCSRNFHPAFGAWLL